MIPQIKEAVQIAQSLFLFMAKTSIVKSSCVCYGILIPMKGIPPAPFVIVPVIRTDRGLPKKEEKKKECFK